MTDLLLAMGLVLFITGLVLIMYGMFREVEAYHEALIGNYKEKSK